MAGSVRRRVSIDEALHRSLKFLAVEIQRCGVLPGDHVAQGIDGMHQCLFKVRGIVEQERLVKGQHLQGGFVVEMHDA